MHCRLNQNLILVSVYKFSYYNMIIVGAFSKLTYLEVAGIERDTILC